MYNEKNEQKRKPGRPRKERNLVLFRQGNRIKAFNPVIGAQVNITEKDMTGNVMIYEGLGADFVAWGRKLTREGYFNTATKLPFRQPEGEIDNVVPGQLEDDFRNCKQFPRFLAACTDLFEGRIPEDTIVLNGVYWMRVLSHIFLREAGVEGISRMRFERPVGMIWAAVNVPPNHGRRSNYTEAAWYAVVNMLRPPVFCVKVTGAEYESASDRIPDSWNPSSLANAILHRLWGQKGGNSCEADVSNADNVAPQPAVAVATPEAAPMARCKTCGRVLEIDCGSGLCYECGQQAKAKAAAEADSTTRRCNICGAIMQGVFADRICTRCAATVNVETDE
jgi:hypothetical protein